MSVEVGAGRLTPQRQHAGDVVPAPPGADPCASGHVREWSLRNGSPGTCYATLGVWLTSGSRRWPRHSGGPRSACPSRSTGRWSPAPSAASRVEDNVAAFGELGFAPHVAGLADSRDLATKVMGQEISFPVLISPTGVQAVHPDGEVAVARAAAARGTAMGLSSFASMPIEEVVAAYPQTFFQIYWIGTRDQILARVERAGRAGAVGLIATLDWSFSHGRDWGSPTIPETVNLRAMLRFAPEALANPRWFLSFARTGKRPDLTTPNMVAKGAEGARPSSAPTASGCRRRRRVGTTWPGCASSGAAPSCSRA